MTRQCRCCRYGMWAPCGFSQDTGDGGHWGRTFLSCHLHCRTLGTNLFVLLLAKSAFAASQVGLPSHSDGSEPSREPREPMTKNVSSDSEKRPFLKKQQVIGTNRAQSTNLIEKTCHFGVNPGFKASKIVLWTRSVPKKTMVSPNRNLICMHPPLLSYEPPTNRLLIACATPFVLRTSYEPLSITE